jgi:hypothetical protein
LPWRDAGRDGRRFLVSEEKHERGSGKRARTLVVCGRCMAVLSAAVVVRVVQKLRRQQREKQERQRHHWHFPLVGH